MKGKKLGILVIAVVVILAVGIYVGMFLPATPVTPTKKFKIFAVLAGDIADMDWNQAMYVALMGLKGDPGFEVTYVSGVYTAVDALPHFSNYAGLGYDMIIGHGYQYGEALAEVARDFPKQTFVFIGDRNFVKDPPTNLIGRPVSSKEEPYVLGVLAGLMTRTKRIGFISAFKSGGIDINVGYYEKGAKSIVPDIVVSTAFTGDWRDVEKAKESVRGMVEAGVDVIMGVGDGLSVGTVLGAKDKGVWAMTPRWDKSSVAPDAFLGSTYENWEIVIRQIYGNIKTGVPLPLNDEVLFASGGAALGPLNPKVPPEVVARIKGIIDNIKTGKLVL